MSVSEMRPAPATPRVRLVAAVVQLNVVVDDGELLRPLQVAPMAVAAVDWPDFSLDAILADLQGQLEQQA
jgi:hypothetical protein